MLIYIDSAMQVYWYQAKKKMAFHQSFLALCFDRQISPTDLDFLRLCFAFQISQSAISYLGSCSLGLSVLYILQHTLFAITPEAIFLYLKKYIFVGLNLAIHLPVL